MLDLNGTLVERTQEDPLGILSQLFKFVNNFFILFFVAHQQLNHLIMYHCFCQQLFYFSQILFYLSHCFRNGTII
jgi:hypothetical protein